MPSINEVLVLHHCHTDIGFTHPQPVLWELQRRFIDRALDLLDETADWPAESQPRWTCETTAPVLHWLRNTNRKQITRFRDFAVQGRLSIGAMLCHFTPLSSADELARSLQPVRELRERFGIPIKVAVVHDVNGLPWPAAQLLLDAGIEMLLMGINIHFGGFPLTRPLAFNWRTSDGRELLTFNGEHYQGFDRVFRLEKGNTGEMAEGFAEYSNRLAAGNYGYDFAFLTATHHTFADNNPPNAATAKLIRQWNQEGRDPKIRYVTPEMFLERLRQLPAIPSYSGEWDDYWSFGVQIAARETRVTRHTRTRLSGAELLANATGKVNTETQERFAQAWRNVQMYNEHTFGSCVCVEHPEFDDAATQWHLKAAYAYTARSLTTLLVRDQLDLAAKNPAEAVGLEGVLMFNPAPFPRQIFVRLPDDWLAGKWDHISSSVPFLELSREKWESGEGTLFGPIKLPAFGYKTLSIPELAQSKSKDAGDTLKVENGSIESPFYRLEYNATTGRILALWDKRANSQLLDTESPWSFFGFVQETVANNGDRESFFEFNWDKIPANISCWRPDWPPQRLSPTKLASASTEVAPDGISLVLKWADAPGAGKLEQRFKLLANRPAIELTATFQKLDIPTPEGIYFTFPLDLPDWKAHFDPANLPAEFDNEQLPGSCRDYTTVGQWVALHNSQRSITLACPDAPLMQIGDFNFAKVQQQVERNPRPLLLAWPMNNYYNVNFRGASQPEPAKFRYELTTAPAFDPLVSTLAGIEAATPIEVHPVVKLKRNREGQIVELIGEGILLLGLRSAKDNKSVIGLFSNVTDQPANATIRFPRRKMSEAWRCGTLEDNREQLSVIDGAAHLLLRPRSLMTARFLLK